MAELFAYGEQKGKEEIELKARSDYRMALLSEHLTGQVARHFVTEEMKWGQGRRVCKDDLRTQEQRVCRADRVCYPSNDGLCGSIP